VLGRLAQAAQVPIALSPRTDLAPSAAMAADGADLTLKTAGFLLASVSFVTFGVLFLRDGHRMLGVVGCVAGPSEPPVAPRQTLGPEGGSGQYPPQQVGLLPQPWWHQQAAVGQGQFEGRHRQQWRHSSTSQLSLIHRSTSREHHRPVRRAHAVAELREALKF
jgi:hypothetical protein